MEPSVEWHRVSPEEVLKAHENASEGLRSEVSFATALANVGRTQEALAKLHDAVQHEPNNYEAFLALGAVLAEAGQGAESIRNMRQAVKIAPDNLFARYGLGLTLQRYRQFEEAKAELTQLVSLGNRSAADNPNGDISEHLLVTAAQKLLDTL